MRRVLDHFGLARPYRFARTLLALVAVIVLLATGVSALVLWRTGELSLGTLRATYFYYLVGLVLAALIALRWTKLAIPLRWNRASAPMGQVTIMQARFHLSGNRSNRTTSGCRETNDTC